MHKYVVELNIPENKNIVVPISMNQEYHSGEKLGALVTRLKELQCNVTFVIADWLRRWCETEAVALDAGERFLKEHASLFDNTKVVRWKNWIESHKEKFDFYRKKLDDAYQSNPVFQKKIERTAKTTISHEDINVSRNYLLEEYAVFLTFNDFDIHVYPQPISSALSYIYVLFPELKLPAYKHSIVKARSQVLRKINNLPLIARTVYGSLEDVLTSSEISDKTKGALITNILNLMVSVYDRLNFEDKDAMDDILSSINSFFSRLCSK